MMMTTATARLDPCMTISDHDWNVAILYRRYDPMHSKSVAERAIRVFQWMQDAHGPYCHVELLFRLPCGPRIPCDCHQQQPSSSHVRLHWVSYSTSWTRGVAYKTIDRFQRLPVHRTQLWDIECFRVCNPARIRAMTDFCESQLGTPFGLWNMAWNFSLSPFMRLQPVSHDRLKPVEDDIERATYVPCEPLKRQKRWFCSELVCAALVVGGIVHTPVSPSTTSPEMLAREIPKSSSYRPRGDHPWAPVALSTVLRSVSSL
jgi:hypothetical protein